MSLSVSRTQLNLPTGLFRRGAMKETNLNYCRGDIDIMNADVCEWPFHLNLLHHGVSSDDRGVEVGKKGQERHFVYFCTNESF